MSLYQAILNGGKESAVHRGKLVVYSPSHVERGVYVTKLRYARLAVVSWPMIPAMV